MSIEHSALVDVASRWLRRTCPVVITELATTGEEPDAIGWHGQLSTLVECKVSLADFRSDAQKYFRRSPEMGIGQHRYFLTPGRLIDPDTLPPRWGLLELTGAKVRVVRKSQLFEEVNARHEIAILLSVLRRIGKNAPESVSVRCYSIETKNRATVSIEEELPHPDPLPRERGTEVLA